MSIRFKRLVHARTVMLHACQRLRLLGRALPGVIFRDSVSRSPTDVAFSAAIMTFFTRARAIRRDSICKDLMKNPTAIASFEMEDSAEPVARKLRDAGFDARVRGESRSRLTSRDVGKESAIYRVVVPAIQTVRAMSWCREFDAAESLLSHALRCPVCGSTRVAVCAQESSNAEESGKAERQFRCDVCSSAWLGGLHVAPFIGSPAVA
jgi:uncharacterized protein with PIN domain